VPLGEEIPPRPMASKRGTPRNLNFTTIGSSSVRTVADRHSTADELSGGTNINDLE